jgi:hypothetical protein
MNGWEKWLLVVWNLQTDNNKLAFPIGRGCLPCYYLVWFDKITPKFICLCCSLCRVRKCITILIFWMVFVSSFLNLRSDEFQYGVLLGLKSWLIVRNTSGESWIIRELKRKIAWFSRAGFQELRAQQFVLPKKKGSKTLWFEVSALVT